MGTVRPREGCPFAWRVKAGGEVESGSTRAKWEIREVCVPHPRPDPGAGKASETGIPQLRFSGQILLVCIFKTQTTVHASKAHFM